MAQHTPIEFFDQKAIKKIADSIRNERNFSGSLKYGTLPREYEENFYDKVFTRSVPKSIMWFRPLLEIHTRPESFQSTRRVATNIYLVA